MTSWLNKSQFTRSVLLAFVLSFTINPALADERYVYEGGFAGMPIDDGNSNFEILDDLLTFTTHNLHHLTSEKNPNQVPTDAAVLVDTMLQVRASCSQRAANIHLKPAQKRQMEVIIQALAPLNLSYHPNERQSLVDLFVKPEYASQIENFKSFMVKSKAFGESQDRYNQ